MMPTCSASSVGPQGNPIPSTAAGNEGLLVTDTANGSSLCLAGTAPTTFAFVKIGSNFDFMSTSQPATFNWSNPPALTYAVCGPPSTSAFDPQPSDSFTIQGVWDSSGGGFASSASSLVEPVTIPTVVASGTPSPCADGDHDDDENNGGPDDGDGCI
jgi:hypothetical protein